MRYAVFGDLHFIHKTNTRPDAGERILEKLSWAATKCEEEGIKTIVMSGDIFDNINVYIPSSYLLRLVEILKRFHQILYITGNHDYHKAYGYTWEDEPIAILHHLAGNMHNIGNTQIMLEDGFTLLGRPWKKQYDLGKGDDLNCPEELDPEKTIVLTHSYLLPKEKNIMGQYISYEDLTRPAKLYLVGHYHDSLGVLRYEDNYLVLMGSVFRKAVSENHDPCFFILDTERIGNLKRVIIPSVAFEDAFIDTSAERELAKIKDGVASFVESIKGTRTVMTSGDFKEAVASIAKQELAERAEPVIKHVVSTLDEANI